MFVPKNPVPVGTPVDQGGYPLIKVDPDQVFIEAWWAIGTVQGPGIAECVDRIVKVWSELKLSWAGATSEEVQSFNEAWSSAIGRLFTIKESFHTGVIEEICAGVEMAAVNYAGMETTVTKMFDDMWNTVEGSSPGPQSPPDPTRHNTGGPITEVT